MTWDQAEKVINGEAGPTPDEIGRATYAAYCRKRGGLTHDGKPCPTWEALGEGVQGGWVEAGLAARAL